MRSVASVKQGTIFLSDGNFSGAGNIAPHHIGKNKKYFVRGMSARITPPFFAALVLSLLLINPVFFTAANAEQGFSSPEESVICPDKAAAEKGSKTDEYNLARAYDKGSCGITADPQQAIQWYTSDAKQGDMLAQYRLGEIYFTGSNGVEPDYPQAKKWYLMAAKQGHGLSQLRLGFLNAEAHFKGLKTDYKEAEKWFLKAAEQDAGDARFRLGNFYHNYKRPPELKKAVYWLTRAAEGGHRVAMFDLARMIKAGEGVKKDAKQALVWMKKSADLDMISAQMMLSNMYAAGDGVPKDPAESLAWTLKVATAPTAIPYWIDKAGDAYFEGSKKIPINYTLAMSFYERAVAKGDAHAETRIGIMYLKGLGVAKDQAKADEYLTKAAAAGDDEAKDLLAAKK